MPNAAVFQTTPGIMPSAVDTVNYAGGAAYAMSPKHALTQYALTGSFNDTFYASAQVQLDKVLELCKDVDNEYIAQLAVYARHEGFMKDTPSFLLAYLSTTDYPRLQELFTLVINNGKMVRNYAQMIRSGVTGRKSFGTKLRRLMRNWLQNADDYAILQATIGNEPSLADVIKMVHPKPVNEERTALYGWIIGKPHDVNKLPPVIKQYIEFVAMSEEDRMQAELPNVPFLMLTSMKLSAAQWKQLASKMTWTQLRMNLNTFQRNDVFSDVEATRQIATRLMDKDSVMRAKAFPYQLMTTYTAVKGNVPEMVSGALHDALEYSLANVPVIEGPLAVLCDTSGSMGGAVMRERNGNVQASTSFIDVAALMTCALMRKNPEVLPIAFDTGVYDLRQQLELRDTVLSNAKKLASFKGGGTDCAAPLHVLCQLAAQQNVLFDTVIMISDNESWVTERRLNSHNRNGTDAARAWAQYKLINPKAKLICIDISPNDTTQLAERPGVTNIGGFSDAVFKLVDQVANGKTEANHWVGEVEKVTF